MVRFTIPLIFLTLLTNCSMSHDKKVKALEKKIGYYAPSNSWESSWENVISASDKLLKYVPNHPRAHFEKGIALHKLGKYKKAINSFDQAIKYIHLTEPSYTKMVLTNSYYEKAQCLRALGKLEEALKYFDLAIKHGLDHRHIHHERTEVLMELGKELD